MAVLTHYFLQLLVYTMHVLAKATRVLYAKCKEERCYTTQVMIDTALSIIMPASKQKSKIFNKKLDFKQNEPNIRPRSEVKLVKVAASGWLGPVRFLLKECVAWQMNQSKAGAHLVLFTNCLCAITNVSTYVKYSLLYTPIKICHLFLGCSWTVKDWLWRAEWL